MLEDTTYTRIYGQQQLGKCLCVAGSQPMSEKLYSRKKFSYVFCIRKNFFITKKSELRYLSCLTNSTKNGRNDDAGQFCIPWQLTSHPG